jgi:Domain of unknown function (DUF1772)
MVFGMLALTVAALFAGAAIYVSFVEHPARAELDDRAQLQQWKPSYTRGAAMQASLALIGFVLGAAAWWTLHDWRWLAGAVLLLAAWPYTLLLIMPTNRALKGLSLTEAGHSSRVMLERWGRLHLGRTALGVLATLLFLAASTS